MITLRRLLAGDIPFADRLCRQAGWNQTSADWMGYLEFEPEGCFVAEVDGIAAGTVTTLTYGPTLGWIGMVLVHADHRRLGVGTALLEHAIAYLRRKGIRCIQLDATAAGMKVYLPLGFKAQHEVMRYESSARRTTHPAAEGCVGLGEDDVSAVAAFDAPIFGVGRAPILANLRRRNPELCCLARAGGTMTGYLIAREGHEAVQVGPWAARDASGARALLDTLLARVPGRRIFFDAPQPNAAAIELAVAAGFTIQRRFTRMNLGDDPPRAEISRIYGTSGAEKG